MNILKKYFASLLFVVFAFCIPLTISLPVSAQDTSCNPNQSVFGIPTWYKYLNATEDSSGRCSPQLNGDINSILPIGLAVLEGLIRLAGLVAVAMVFYGGFKYITSQGSPDAAAAGQKTVINAIIGLVIVVLATSLVSFVGNSLI